MSTLRKRISKIDYTNHLEKMWHKHIATKPDNAPTVISTFAGGGGSSLGFSMAGFKELLAVEWDKNAVETFKLNFHDVPIFHGDIAKLSIDKCLELSGTKPYELDVFDGSPPCQGFSTAGKRIMNDSRNQLFREYVRLLRGLKPKVFVMENVSGMIKGKMKLVFAEIMRELKSSGYQVSARLLNAKYFHVPQSRERIIFIGIRNDLGISPSHPKAESHPIGIKYVLPDVLASRSMKINEWMYHPRPSATITKTSSDYQFKTINGVRKPHLDEIILLGSFPNKFLWKSHAWERIGNSVPPLMMEAIARHIRENILTQINITTIATLTGETPKLAK